MTRWIDLYLETAFVAGLTAAVVLLGGRLLAALGVIETPAPSRATVGLIVALLALSPALVATLLSLRRSAPAAAEADRVLGLEERLVTAAELLGRPQTGVASLLMRDVAPRVERTPAGRVYPLPRVGYRAGLVLVLLALAVVAMSPPGLTWERVKQDPLSVLGFGELPPIPPEPIASAPTIDFEGMPREGKAPLKVFFLGYARANLESWEWDFGDATVVTGTRAQEHTYEQPGWYTVKLRAAGAECVKERYIHVTSDDGSSGGNDTARPMAFPASADGVPQFGDPPDRPKIDTKAHDVTPLDQKQGPTVDKERAVYTPGPGGAGDPPPQFPETFESYRRVAEESIGHDRIPAPLADYVRAYFDRIRP